MTAFEAKYRGRCAAGDEIEPGDQVVYVNDELVHVDCEGRALREVVLDICPECFIARPCEHDDERRTA